LSPKKWISSNISFSKCFKQYVLSHPFGNTSKLICPPAKITSLWHNWKHPVSKLNKWSKYYMQYSLSWSPFLIPMFQPFKAGSHELVWKHVWWFRNVQATIRLHSKIKDSKYVYEHIIKLSASSTSHNFVLVTHSNVCVCYDDGLM
jgi:hypothetical protein